MMTLDRLRAAPVLTRRSALMGGTAFASTVLAARSLMAQDAGQKPKVFLDLTQEELDRAYDQAHWAPNAQQVIKRYALASDRTRARLGPPKTVSYGATKSESLDIFATSRPGAPILVFIHGGAWRGGFAKDSAYLGEPFVGAGAHYVALDFAPVQEVGLDGMVTQVRKAVAWVYKHAGTFGGDPERLYVAGHSSGGHLAGCVLVTDWAKDFGLAPDVVKGGLCVSGMFDLKGPRLSARSSYVPFTDAIEHAYSSQRHLDKLNCPVTVAHGTLESPEFQRQSREFAEALKKAGRLNELVVAAEYNHFEIIETLANPYGLLGTAMLRQMKLV